MKKGGEDLRNTSGEDDVDQPRHSSERKGLAELQDSD
jgi:hypothetical protein